MPISPQKVDKAKQMFEKTRKGTIWTPRNKLLATLALVYLVLPFDLLPEWLFPLVGLLDDMGVLSLAALWIFSHRGSPPSSEQNKE